MFARTLLAALLVASVAFPVKAQAYDFLKSPSGRVASVSQREIVFRLPAQVPEGLTKEEVRAAVERALQRWSEASGLVLRVAEGVADAPTGCASEGMRVNDIVFVQRGWKRMGGAVAETPVCIGDSTGNIYGADILLNASDYKFAVLDADHPKAIGAFDLEAVLVHEVGHALGMDHSKVKDAVMWGGGKSGDVSKRVLAEDDVVGIQALYPAGSVLDDGAVGCSSAGGGLHALGLLGLCAVLVRARRK